MTYFVFGFVFYIGGYFRENHGLSFVDMFRSLFTLLWAAFGAGMLSQYAGDTVGAVAAAKRIYEFADAKDFILNSPNAIK